MVLQQENAEKGGFHLYLFLESQVEAAEARGENVVDLTFSMSESVGDDVGRLRELLEAAEAYSVRGKLLTMAPPTEVRRFRRWYVREVVEQLGGAPPRKWTAR